MPASSGPAAHGTLAAAEHPALVAPTTQHPYVNPYLLLLILPSTRFSSYELRWWLFDLELLRHGLLLCEAVLVLTRDERGVLPPSYRQNKQSNSSSIHDLILTSTRPSKFESRYSGRLTWTIAAKQPLK